MFQCVYVYVYMCASVLSLNNQRNSSQMSGCWQYMRTEIMLCSAGTGVRRPVYTALYR